MTAFKAYDIRGVYNIDFSKDDVYRIGFHLPALLKTGEVLVGRDVRSSSEEIYEYLCKGITDSGADVCSAGLTTTPMIYFATSKHHFDASVQITASHNPPEYNGLKISTTDSIPVGYETGLSTLEKIIQTKEIHPVREKGAVENIDLTREYIDFMNHYAPDITNLRLGIDCSNGMAALIIKQILGNTPVYIYDTLDGSFPNHEPNPLIYKNVKDLIELVTDSHLDAGIIFDGDADRVMFVDERGRFVRPDLIIAMLALYYLDRKKENVLFDIRTSRDVSEYITNLGGVPNMWKVGHAFAKIKLRELNAVFGGELAGHYYFRDFFNCDSGILACLIVLNILVRLKNEGQTFASFIDSISSRANSNEMNFKITDKAGAVTALRDAMTSDEKPTAIFDFDGYRIEFKDWWFNVRPSNTEPYLRLIVEAKTDILLKSKLEEIESILDDFKDPA